MSDDTRPAANERAAFGFRMFGPGHGRELLAWLLPVALATTDALGVAAALMDELRRISIEVYRRGSEHAAERGIILADTKFEFGRDKNGRIVVGDEVLTPDSSRFWPADTYEPGRSQPSFDKQFVRDWASSTGWDRNPPAPAIPDDIVERTRAKYVEAYERVTGDSFANWLRRTGVS